MHTWQTLLAMLQTWFCSIAHVVYIVACSTVVCVVVQNVLVLIASCANVVCAAVRAFFFCNNLPSLFAHVLFFATLQPSFPKLCQLMLDLFLEACVAHAQVIEVFVCCIHAT